MDFLELPFEVFVNFIFCHFDLVDFTRFLCTNKAINEGYDRRELWRICYLKKKQKTFRENELKKTRKLIWHEYYHEGLFDWQRNIPRRMQWPLPPQELKKCSLVIENKSDVLYNVSFMSSGYYHYPNKNAMLEEKKNCGIVKPGSKKIISSYVGHMFEIRHEVKPRDDCEKSYKTHYIVLKKEGILTEPYLWKNMKGEEKVSKNSVVITLKGETYDKSVKEWLDIAHPFYSLKKFKDFKKQHKKLYMSEMKKKDKENSEKKRLLSLRITDKKNLLKAMSEQFQQEIFEMETVLKKAEKETLPLDSYFER
jgi:hypothetical protein